MRIEREREKERESKMLQQLQAITRRKTALSEKRGEERKGEEDDSRESDT